MISAGLLLRVHGPLGSSERIFTRLPVLIGRNVGPTQCMLADDQVSKLHASLDYQDGMIVLRDVGSTNGTFVGGTRLPASRWIQIGSADHPGQVKISEFHIEVSVVEDNVEAPSLRSSTLAELLDSQSTPGSPALSGGPAPSAASLGPRRYLSPGEIAAQAPQVGPAGTYQMRGPSLRVMQHYVNVVGAMKELHDSLAVELQAAPPEARASVCDRIIKTYPTLANEPIIQTLLRAHGWSGAPPAGAGESPLAVAALQAMQDLAGWYIGRNRPLLHPGDVATFKERLRATLDEFLLGYIPLMTGMTRFASQMAIRQATADAIPSSPAELASRLLDWTTNNDDLRARLRASFAELMMHQVALLNGVMSGVRALLTEQQEGQRRGGLAGMFRLDPWEVYRRRHSDLADEENERFRVLFGHEFVDEYQQFTQEVRAASPDGSVPQFGGSGELPVPPGGAGKR